MKQRFDSWREAIRSIERGSSSLLKSFSGQLFKNSPWFLARFESNKTPSEKNIVNAKEEVSQVEQVSEVKSEKEQTIDSLREFASNKASEGRGVVQFEGGEIEVKESQDSITSYKLQSELPGSIDLFYNEINECKKCFEEIRPNKALHRIDLKSENVQVLFVGDVLRSDKKKEGNDCFSKDVNDLLQNMIKAMKLSPSEFALSLAVKCPLSQVDEEKRSEEISLNCTENIYKEIMLLKPKIVITLGAIVTNAILGTKERISNIHGQFYSKKIVTSSNEEFVFKYVPIFHPDFLLINPSMKRAAWIDLQKVMKFLGKL